MDNKMYNDNNQNHWAASAPPPVYEQQPSFATASVTDPGCTTNSTTTINNPVYLLQGQQFAMNYGPFPLKVICPSCHASVKSVMTPKGKPKCTQSCFMCWICFWSCGCANTDFCHSQNHHCPNCKALLGSYDR